MGLFPPSKTINNVSNEIMHLGEGLCDFYLFNMLRGKNINIVLFYQCQGQRLFDSLCT